MSVKDHVMSAGWSVSVLRLDTFLPPFKLLSGEMEMEINGAFFSVRSTFGTETVSTDGTENGPLVR